MKKRVLLVDESLTVQKVVALTLDRHRYSILYAKSRSEAMKLITESPPELILVSDHVTDITTSSFPKEVEAWMGRSQGLPPVVLITGQDVKEARHYAAVLKKPFSPQALQSLVSKLTQGMENDMRSLGETTVTNHNLHAKETAPAPVAEEFEDTRFQKIFNDAFSDEAHLTRETLKSEIEEEEKTLIGIQVRHPGTTSEADADDPMWAAPPSAAQRQPAASRGGQAQTPSELWNAGVKAQKAGANPETSALLGAEDSMAYKAVLENKVAASIEDQDLDAVVDKILNRIVPPIVERLVQERLDKLLKEHEQFVELKQ